VGRLLAERQPERSRFRLASDAGSHTAEVEHAAGVPPAVRVELAPPRFALAAIPADPAALELLAEPGVGPARVRLEAAGAPWEGLILSVGNPHLIVPLGVPLGVPLRDFPVRTLGAALERHAAFPERINVGFLHLDGAGNIALRTFERGSGETLACGSNAVAAVVALCALGAWKRDREAWIAMPGGTLRATWTQAGGLWLGGPTRLVFEGSLPQEVPGEGAVPTGEQG
jgi:diaminopimelate epimerase